MEGTESMGVVVNVYGEDGDQVKAWALIYRAFFQAVIIYGSKI